MTAPQGQFDDESASASTSVSLELLEELPLGASRGKGKKLVGSRLARPRSLVKWQRSERIPMWDAVLPGPWTPELPTMTKRLAPSSKAWWPWAWRHRVSVGTQQQPGKTKERRCLPGALGWPQTSEAQSWARGYVCVCVCVCVRARARAAN